MNGVEMKQAPLLAGWAIAAGVGLVAFGVTTVVMGFSLTQAVAVGLVLLLIVGVILGLPSAEADDAPAPAAVRVEPEAPVMAQPLMATAPMADPVMPVPLMAAPMAPETGTIGRRPESLAAAREGGPDDLKQIKGVGPVLEKLLHSLGFYHFDQIANWTGEEVAWVDENLEGFKGRVSRDDWVAQARILAAGGTTEFANRVEDGEVY